VHRIRGQQGAVNQGARTPTYIHTLRAMRWTKKDREVSGPVRPYAWFPFGPSTSTDPHAHDYHSPQVIP